MSANNKIIKLAQEIDILSQRMATGNLLLNSHAKQGNIYIFYGRLLYTTGNFHRVRRWQRGIELHCPKWKPITLQLSDQEKPWEYILLYDGITRDEITLYQAKKVIRTVTLEILFSLSLYVDLTCQWEQSPDKKSELSLGLALCYRELEEIFSKVNKMQNLWQKAGFNSLNPNLVPVMTKTVKPEALSGWGKYLHGDLTIWDIAYQLRKSVLAVTKTLFPLVKKGLVQLKTVPDLSTSPIKSSLTTANSQKSTDKTTSKKQSLIACIDDSPVVTETLKKIVQPAGYRFISIQDPIKGFVKIAEYKPDLIFLDLEMPHANGYTVYQFLRKAPAFEKIPVIIFTHRNNVIDRSRAKLIGAADFLSKPPKPEEILKMIQKHLPHT
ncbi:MULTISPECIES: response regulator [unclassified Okeania]|uniref:response regulator n=1 Tax=unclassified Okeania TaxID=2634635 RepID=UPI0013B657E6|nr:MULTISPECIES: response regulator [unclassified Okeania]NET12375.1 response regulator [Okeania sp. SIO1H6]NEP70558.1 response regulator [Okeania sp. SIO2G5]NEP93243.1 response regulator [Okeania sp. SIO2F5]NEQ89273.1 response regulator [Okeania sp. SIO2G4]NES79275.1 response regulator [Okeania sp. SIO1H4]